MELTINGKKHELNVMTLEEVVSHFELESHLVVTEVNGKIIERDEWAKTKVEAGTEIELVHFVGGG
ncbi:thiamine biosynthesis protein ThiS [Alkalihalobacillus alcalophilus ATCC 27647 = CGMCC 1.3604]|uniref:Thiamine biosynthesis protein ThiS n=1 Tax=Alkalihalobacillus alcalophilus ATCC 27647 = CGMCC 1.3604 TaxID=1218173 RepID=A0A094XDI3_ALKAL|nr:sulfur carrier protein ThiS [Alkalihalobacillus alcalophilus]KGA96830.1 thiamine biosynthesis protein ThiS [Alkalihalobacillus alcalophilus ATCC 27647 = CGMCC 1.3604]MED1561219.1 sulfur carrier protein ThiS [Alkalihalobacillus alcalophilus]THG88852.1 thiamine biosynthesis protein ThiS [Alkalihalobacillus alcalophilus ATCC 27647 = CGMCC 1.3604]